MPIEQDMINILQNETTRQIAFSFTSTTGSPVTVNQSSFQRIVLALQNNKFEISDDINAGRAAYKQDSTVQGKQGKFRVKAGSIPVEFESLIVHESVHASFDLTYSVLPWIDNETAAHLAQGYYYHLKHINDRAINVEPVRIARITAVSIASLGSVPDVALELLRDSIRTFPPYWSYINGIFRGNG